MSSRKLHHGAASRAGGGGVKRRRLRKLNGSAMDISDSVSELSVGIDRSELWLTTMGVQLPSKAERRARLRTLASSMSQTSVAALGLRGPATMSESGAALAPFADAAAVMRDRLGATATALFPDPASPPPAAIAEMPSVASSNDSVLLPRFGVSAAPHPRLLIPPPLPDDAVAAVATGPGVGAGPGRLGERGGTAAAAAAATVPAPTADWFGQTSLLSSTLDTPLLGQAAAAPATAEKRRRLPSAQRGPVGQRAVDALGGSMMDLRAARRRSMVRGNVFNTTRQPLVTLDEHTWRKRPLLDDIKYRFPPWGSEEGDAPKDDGQSKSRFSDRPLLHSIRERFPKITKHSLPPGMEFTAFGSTTGGAESMSMSMPSPPDGGGGGGDAIPHWPWAMDLSSLRVEFDNGTQTMFEGDKHEPWDKRLKRSPSAQARRNEKLAKQREKAKLMQNRVEAERRRGAQPRARGHRRGPICLRLSLQHA